jgi:TolB-like protein/class 3 adenylate cyclase/Tfp pilus assembly protein PilF
MSAEVKAQVQMEIGHILFIDTVGYSRLTIDEQREAQESLSQVVRGTDCFRNAEAAGKLIRLPTGDGMALVFSDDIEAPLKCALEISASLRTHSPLSIRMGIHSGPVSRVVDVNDRMNVAGAGVNIAQRVMSCGDTGHILLSRRVADDLAPYRQWQPCLHDLGEYEFKHGLRLHLLNLCKDDLGNRAVPERLRRGRLVKRADRGMVRPVSIFPRWAKPLVVTSVVVSLGAAAITSSLLLRRSGAGGSMGKPPEKSIAVLPFENFSEEKSNAYFAEGIQDEILTRLSKIADLKVISRTSTQHYKSSPANLRDIARELGVAHILEGSVQRSGNAVRVNVQLIKAANDSHIWADTFDRDLNDIFSVESEVAKAIADRLRAKLTGREEEVITAKPTDNPGAYDAYLRGLAYTLKAENARANSLAAQRYLREAVKLDQTFALGWALLSYNDSLGYISGTLEPTNALREEAQQAAETALALQPNLGEALLAKGYYHYACLKDYDTAMRYFEQARQFLPNSSRIPEALAYVARRRGQWDLSESYFNEAERLDPRNVSILTSHAHSYVALRRFADALRKLDQVLDIAPDDMDTLAKKAGVAQAEGDLSRAAVLLAPLHPGPDDSSVLETQAYQAILERHPAEMVTRLREILASPDPALEYLNGDLRFWLGWTQQAAGDRAAAQQSWRQARVELESLRKEQPDNFGLIGDLALTDIALRNKVTALALSEQAMATTSIEKDALMGPASIEIFARVTAQAGESDRAIAALEKLLSIPYSGPLPENLPLTPALLKLDPMFDALRGNSRFEKLIASPVAKAVNE